MTRRDFSKLSIASAIGLVIPITTEAKAFSKLIGITHQPPTIYNPTTHTYVITWEFTDSHGETTKHGCSMRSSVESTEKCSEALLEVYVDITQLQLKG